MTGAYIDAVRGHRLCVLRMHGTGYLDAQRSHPQSRLPMVLEDFNTRRSRSLAARWLHSAALHTRGCQPFIEKVNTRSTAKLISQSHQSEPRCKCDSATARRPHVTNSCSMGVPVSAVVGRLPSLPSPAARSDSSIVYAGSLRALHRRLCTLLRQ